MTSSLTLWCEAELVRAFGGKEEPCRGGEVGGGTGLGAWGGGFWERTVERWVVSQSARSKDWEVSFVETYVHDSEQEGTSRY